MPSRSNSGECRLCGKTFSGGSMHKHLQSCLKNRERRAGETNDTAFWIVAKDRYLTEYWLQLLVRATATLDDLDEYLRTIWLECCGHMSAFVIGGQPYSKHPFDEDLDMDVELKDVLQPGMRFQHDYDFGSTTSLIIEVKEEREAPFKKKDYLILLARNLSPEIPCAVCGQPATDVCTECMYDGNGWFCRKCLKKHDCGIEMALPMVNSPRVGVCGYTGPE